ncbi:MAG TPA: hypothetical protein VGT41_00130 [Candidatus Babeliales bacterium]|nr:hypothetical protein [Candidatus Babeliales bacterium]
MNVKKSLWLTILTCLSVQHTLLCDEIITLFFQPYPLTTIDNSATSIVNQLKEPGQIAHHSINGTLQKHINSGIFVSYRGYITASDNNGQIVFPRKHPEPKITILITSKIVPVIKAYNTIEHWELDKGTPAAMYVAERKQDMPSELYYWDMKQVPLPNNKQLNREALIIFARPEDIYVPKGITLSKNMPNLILPDLFVKREIRISPNILYVLNIKHFFGPMGSIQKQLPSSYIKHIQP